MLNLSKQSKEKLQALEMLQASIESFNGNNLPLENLLRNIIEIAK